ADSQSNPTNNPGFKQGVRIGSAKDGKVTAFIPEPSAEAGTPEGVGVDDAGNVYGGYTAEMAVRGFVEGWTAPPLPGWGSALTLFPQQCHRPRKRAIQ